MMTENILNPSKSEHNSPLNDGIQELTDHLMNTSRNNSSNDGASAPKKPRTSEDFYLFCKFILDHENYKKDEKVNGSSEVVQAEKPLTNGFSGSDINIDISINYEDETESEVDVKIQSDATLHKEDFKLDKAKGVRRKNLKSKLPVGSEDELSTDEESYDLVTCFCAKPYAGRPMIECSKCLTWIHLSCVKLRRSNIPDVFICPSCKVKSK